MRLGLSLMIFLMASVTVAGAIVTVALSVPALGLDRIEVFGWVAGAGFILAAPASYWVAGMLLRSNSASRGDS